MSAMQNLKIHHDLSASPQNNWISLVMPIWWCPCVKLCPWLLKVRIEKLPQLGRWDDEVWAFT